MSFVIELVRKDRIRAFDGGTAFDQHGNLYKLIISNLTHLALLYDKLFELL